MSSHRKVSKKSAEGKNKRRRHKETAFGRFLGGVWCVEDSFSYKNGHHPHMHMLVLHDGKVPQEQLSREWYEATGDSFVVSINSVSTARDRANGRSGEYEVANKVKEVCKYPLKHANMPPKAKAEFWDVAKGRQLTNCFGLMRKIDIESLMDAEDFSPDEIYTDYFARLDFKTLKYQLFQGGTYNLSDDEVSIAMQAIARKVPKEEHAKGRFEDDEVIKNLLNDHRRPEMDTEALFYLWDDGFDVFGTKSDLRANYSSVYASGHDAAVFEASKAREHDHMHQNSDIRGIEKFLEILECT